MWPSGSQVFAMYGNGTGHASVPMNVANQPIIFSPPPTCAQWGTRKTLRQVNAERKISSEELRRRMRANTRNLIGTDVI